MSQRFKILTPYYKLLPHFPFKDMIVLKICTQQAAKRTTKRFAKCTYTGYAIGSLREQLGSTRPRQAAWPPSHPALGCQPRAPRSAPGVSTEEEAARQHAEDGGKTGQKTKEREKNEGRPKHFNDDSC